MFIFFDEIYETFYIHKQIPPSQWTWIYLLAYCVDKNFFSVVAPSSLVINMNLLYLHSCHSRRYAYLGKVLCSPFQIADMYQNKIHNISNQKQTITTIITFSNHSYRIIINVMKWNKLVFYHVYKSCDLFVAHFISHLLVLHFSYSHFRWMSDKSYHDKMSLLWPINQQKVSYQ